MTNREKASARAERIGTAVGRYRRMPEIPYGPQQAVVEVMDELRHVGLATRGEPQDVLVVLEESFSGKTTAARILKRRIEAGLPPGSDRVPVVIATAAASCSSRDLAVALLRGLGVRFAPGMTEDAMWELWPRACQRHGAQLAIVDEIQHAHDGRFTKGVTNTLKNQLARNIPLVVMGTRAAGDLFTSNDGFVSRVYDTVHLAPIDFGDDVDAAIWTGFCCGLDAAMVEADLVAAPAGLGAPPIAERLCRAARGRIGLLKRIVQTALRLSKRRGSPTIEVRDLEKAVDVWCVALRIVAINPFRGTPA